jgi:hypothetical protein
MIDVPADCISVRFSSSYAENGAVSERPTLGHSVVSLKHMRERLLSA